jgi:hypothetical protein
MMLVQFSIYFPELVRKLINYNDVAMESFLVLSGFMMGNHYLNKFTQDKKGITKKLYSRVLKIILIQYILVLTISLPHHVFISGNADSIHFLLESLSFSNQVGLIHILTIFIPLFLISPLILLLLSKNRDILLISVSLLLFISGQFGLATTVYGETTIFPVILWQVYFVAGCILGKYSLTKQSVFPENINKTLSVSLIFLVIALALKFMPVNRFGLVGDHFAFLNVSRFPLNFAGLFYSSASCFFIYSITAKYWHLLARFKYIDTISIFGRHSMLVFFIHVYFAKIADMLSAKHLIDHNLIYVLILANFVFTLFILHKYESSNKDSKELFGRTIKFVFG